MSPKKGDRRRLTVDLTRKQYDDLVRLIPWSLKGEVFRILTDGLIRLLKKDRDAVLGAVFTAKLSGKTVYQAGVNTRKKKQGKKKETKVEKEGVTNARI